MYMHEQLLSRLVQDRSQELARQAQQHRRLSPLRSHWRDRLARQLIDFAERLAVSDFEEGAGRIESGRPRQLAGN